MSPPSLVSTDRAMRLNEASAADAPNLPKLSYDRSQLRTGIVHLGLGAFHRAHQAVFTHRAIEQLEGADAHAWGSVGVSMRSTTVRDQLEPQDGLYTVHERSSVEGGRILLIGCVLRCLVYPESPSEVLELLAHPDVRIVSLTVTEKGYCYEPSTRELDRAHPDIVHDLEPANAQRPRSAVGLLVAALRMRRQRGVPPFTVLSCDNLPHNGRTVGRICAAFARALEPEGDLGAWLAEKVAFPSTMVDCIVPATTGAQIDRAAAHDGPLGGLRDEAMVCCEPFRQWVIEDAFGPLGRPPWDRVGAQLTHDVEAFEHVKLQCVNGCHSTLAYTGALGGVEMICDAMEVPALRALAAALLEHDALPTLAAPAPDVDLREYAATVLRRFSNRELQHRTEQVAMDGSQKLPQRLLTTARARLAAGAKLHVVPLAVAAWMRYVTRTRTDDSGALVAVKVADPLADRFAAIALEARGDARALASKLLAVQEVFGDDELVRNADGFVEPIVRHLTALLRAADSGPSAVLAHVEAEVGAMPATSLLA